MGKMSNHQAKGRGECREAEEEEDGEEERSRYYSGDECDPNPSYLAPLNDTFIEWVYIFDLDREVFSVNNSIHFKLDQVPYINWKDVKIWTVNAPILASLVPEDALVSLVATPSHMAWADTPGEQVCIGQCTHLHGLTFVKPATPNCRIVTPKGIRDIPWHLRHGPGLAMDTVQHVVRQRVGKQHERCSGCEPPSMVHCRLSLS